MGQCYKIFIPKKGNNITIKNNLCMQSIITKQDGLLNGTIYCIINAETNVASNQLKISKTFVY